MTRRATTWAVATASLAAGLLLVTTVVHAGSGSGTNNGWVAFDVSTPNGGDTTYAAVKAALHDWAFGGTVVKSGIDKSVKPAELTSFEVRTDPAFVFDVETLLDGLVASGETVRFREPEHLALLDLDGTAGIVGPDELEGPNDVVGPDEYTITVGMGVNGSVTLGTLTGSAGDDTYADGSALADATTYTHAFMTIANAQGSGGSNTFRSGSIAVVPAGQSALVLKWEEDIVVPEGGTRSFWITASGDLLDATYYGYTRAAMIGPSMPAMVVLSYDVADTGTNDEQLFLFPKGTPGRIAAEIEIGSAATAGQAATVAEDGNAIFQVQFLYDDVTIRNVYRQKSDGTYELIGTPGTGYAAYIYSDRELQPGTKIVLSKSMTLVVEDLWNPCTGLTPSPDGELWRGLFD